MTLPEVEAIYPERVYAATTMNMAFAEATAAITEAAAPSTPTPGAIPQPCGPSPQPTHRATEGISRRPASD